MFGKTLTVGLALVLAFCSLAYYIPGINATAPAFGSDDSPTTGTTGDTYSFDVAVSDEDGSVLYVNVTWEHGSFGEMNAPMNDDGDGTWSYTISLDDSTSAMAYSFTATDDDNESAQTSTAYVAVTDNDAPSFGTDNSPTNGYTLDDYIFDIAVSDNIGVSGVTATWAHGSLSGTDEAINDDLDGTWSYLITLDDSISSMTYSFAAYDDAGNSVTTGTRTVTVSDNDPPTFDNNVLDPDPPMTGGSVEISVGIADNFGVDFDSVVLYYDFGTISGSSTVYTMSGDTVTFALSVPDDTPGLSYYFEADDDSGNTGTSDTYIASIHDDEYPTFGTDYSPTSWTTGDPYTFDITANDNVRVASITVNWTHGSLGETNGEMSDDLDGTWSYTIILDGSLSPMTYSFNISDAWENYVMTRPVNVSVTDNDAPTFDNDFTSPDGYTGDAFTFSVDITDNIGVSGVYIHYWFENGSPTNASMAGPSPYAYSITIPISSLDKLYYMFYAYDAAGHWPQTQVMIVTINDNDGPTFTNNVLNPNPPTTGGLFSISIDIYDNLAVDYSSIVLYHDFGTGYTTATTYSTAFNTATFKVTAPSSSSGVSYYFEANDPTGNTGTSTIWTSSVTDNVRPVFGTDVTRTMGYTGDPFDFGITVTDNIGVYRVNVEYWYGSGPHTNASMTGTNPHAYRITLPSDATISLNYFFYATDAIGNWIVTSRKTVTIADNDRPTFDADSTPLSGTTGERIIFSITVIDNQDVSRVTVEYWFGTESHANESMSGSNPYVLMITLPLNSTSSLHYIFHAADTVGNWAVSIEKTVTVIDNDRPSIGVDNTPKYGTTGDKFVFSISVIDNIGISKVNVEYWYDSSPHTNVSMSGTNPYSYEATIPSDSTNVLHYIFHARDGRGNWAINTETIVTIIDNDKPTFMTDNTPLSGTTGDAFTFSVIVSDNIGVTAVMVEFWYGSGPHTNVSMMGSGPRTYSLNVPEDTTSPLHYVFYASDEKGNWEASIERSVAIIDNDRPTFGPDSTPTSGTTGDPFVFNVQTTDNIGVTKVAVEYWFGTGSRTNVSMSGTDPYTYQATAPSGSIDALHYIFHARDSKGNWGSTSERTMMIVDDDRPVFGPDSSPTSGTTGDRYEFDISVSDNIGVSSVNVEFWYGEGIHTNISMAGTGPFTYALSNPADSVESLHYIVRSMDAKGNWENTIERTVTITDDDRPLFGTDPTPSFGNTGDQFTFGIEVIDNIGVTEVYIEYWFGVGTHTNVTMIGSATYSYGMTIPSDSLDVLSYVFHTGDGAGNWVRSNRKLVTIKDNDGPVVGNDLTPASAATGDTFTFSIEVTDNIGISAVYVEYWFGAASPKNASMSGTGPYNLAVEIPGSSIDQLFYLFHAIDTSGCWGTTSQRSVVMNDNDRPIFGTDTTTSSLNTGDTMTFTIKVSDNIGIEWVSVEYWYGSGAPVNASMEGSGTYTFEMTLVASADEPLHYIFHAKDTSGNQVKANAKEVKLHDNDAPVLTNDRSSLKAKQGEMFIFSISSSDNGQVSKVMVEYWIDEGVHTKLQLDSDGEYSMKLQNEKGSDLHYRFIAEDQAGNKATSETYTIGIEKKDAGTPWIIIGVAAMVLVLILALVAFMITRRRSKTIVEGIPPASGTATETIPTPSFSVLGGPVTDDVEPPQEITTVTDPLQIISIPIEEEKVFAPDDGLTQASPLAPPDGRSIVDPMGPSHTGEPAQK